MKTYYLLSNALPNTLLASARLGVTHLPEVQVVDLREVFAKVATQRDSDVDAEREASEAPIVVCIVLATDGVWDNWTYEDVTKFVMDASCLKAVGGGEDGADRIAKAFMQRNAIYARRNFGAQADNATGILAYLSFVPLYSGTPQP